MKNEFKRLILLEFSGWTKFEIFFLSFGLSAVFFSGYILRDTKIAIISALFGILYTVIAGKGKISCYFFGITCTLLYTIISFQIGLWGNFFLHLFYYFPMEILGFFNWSKHLKKTTKEIIKTKLSKNEVVLGLPIVLFLSLLLFVIFEQTGDPSSLFDSLITVFSLAGMYLTVKRCIEQWLVWTIVNLLSILMWFSVFANGEAVFSILLVRIFYFFIGIYFYCKWREETCKSFD